MKKVIYILLLASMVLTSCNTSPGPVSSPESTEAHAHDDGEGHSHSEEGHTHSESIMDGDFVELTKEQVSNIGIRFGRIAARTIRSLVKLTGRIELPPSGRAIVGSALEGKITHVHVVAGQRVAAGQRLFTLQNLEIIDWQQDLSAQKARMEFLEKELDRQKTLADEDLGPLKNYQQIQSEKKQVEARIAALVSKLRAIGMDHEQADYQSMFYVTAPSSGTIQHLRVSNGEYIQTNTALAEIINSSSLHLHLQAYGTDIVKLSTGQRLDFFVQSRPQQLMKAEVFWINQMINEGTNSYDVHAEIQGDLSRLSAGEFVEARVISEEETVQAIPIEAVTMDKGLYYLFMMDHVHDEDVSFRKVQIMIGESDLGYVEVKPIDPIPTDAEIVIKGAFFLMAQSKKGEEGAGGHHH